MNAARRGSSRKATASDARVLLFAEDPARAQDLEDHLAREGFVVHTAHGFIEAVPYLAASQAELMLVCLPEVEFVCNTLLAEARAAAPSRPVIALAQEVTDGLERRLALLGVGPVLPLSTPWPTLMSALERALEGAEGPPR